MIKDGKAYFINPWFNREVQMPEFAGVEWGEAGRRPFINEQERDEIAAALLRFAEKQARDEQATFAAAIERQRVIAEQGEIDRLAALSRYTRPILATPAAEVAPARPITPPAPPRATTAQKKATVNAPAGRGLPIRVVINSGPLDLRRITARIATR